MVVTTQAVRPTQGGILQVQASHGLQPVFDDPNLVSAAGLPAVLNLADTAGLTDLLDEHLSVPAPSATVKTRTLLAGMLAGADDIDGMDILRAGSNPAVLGEVRAPSTLGTFLRSFTHGHALQLGRINRRLLSRLSALLPSLVGEGLVLVDLDDTIRQTHGYQKQGAAYGYNKTKGLNAMVAAISTKNSAPLITAAGLRRGNIRSGANAGWHASRALTQASDMAPGQQKLLRADSAFCTHETVAAAQQARAWFSITIPAWPTVTRAISQIPETDWAPIHYTNAVWDDEARAWISDAEVAEIGFTAFTSRRKAEHVSCRLVVRRVKRLGQSPAGQDGLFETYRYHAFITNSTLPVTEADRTHRHHAVIEQVIAELKGGPLAHLPSGKFGANQAWLGLAVLVFNLSRATAHAAGMPTARIPTIRETLISLPGRIARRARRLVLHLPEAWPWEHQWTRLWNTATSPPPATTS